MAVRSSTRRTARGESADSSVDTGSKSRVKAPLKFFPLF